MMNGKKIYEKPRAEVFTFQVEDELMSDTISNGTGSGIIQWPDSEETQGLNDASSYQLPD